MGTSLFITLGVLCLFIIIVEIEHKMNPDFLGKGEYTVEKNLKILINEASNSGDSKKAKLYKKQLRQVQIKLKKLVDELSISVLNDLKYECKGLRDELASVTKANVIRLRACDPYYERLEDVEKYCEDILADVEKKLQDKRDEIKEEERSIFCKIEDITKAQNW